jgi:RNA polymerase sigma factor (sigma-70 family)
MEPEPISSLRLRLHCANTAAPADATAVERLRSRLWQQTRRELGGVPASIRHAEPGPASSPGDRELLARCRAGDAAAFDLLFHRHGPRLLGYARRHLDAADADDAVQEAWIAFVRKRDAVPADVELGAWLFGVVRKQVLRQLAQAARRKNEPLPDELPAAAEDLAWLCREAQAQQLAAALEDCDPLDQDIAVGLLEGVAPAALAQQLGLTDNAFRVRKHRLIARLRKRLGDGRDEASA